MQRIFVVSECSLKPQQRKDLFQIISNHNTMGLIREPKNIDLSTKSEEWTEKELIDFRNLMKEIKAKNAKRKLTSAKSKRKRVSA